MAGLVDPPAPASGALAGFRRGRDPVLEPPRNAEGMENTASLAERRATRGSHVRLRSARQPAPVRQPRTSTVGLGDLIPLGNSDAAARATDGPKVQQRHRICLPNTLQQLGWTQGDTLRISVVEGTAVIANGGRGRAAQVNVGNRIYLPAGVVNAMGATVGDTLAAYLPARAPRPCPRHVPGALAHR